MNAQNENRYRYQSREPAHKRTTRLVDTDAHADLLAAQRLAERLAERLASALYGPRTADLHIEWRDIETGEWHCLTELEATP